MIHQILLRSRNLIFPNDIFKKPISLTGLSLSLSVLDHMLSMSQPWVESLGTHTHSRLPYETRFSSWKYDGNHGGMWISVGALI
jgi:hypothetical protein